MVVSVLRIAVLRPAMAVVVAAPELVNRDSTLAKVRPPSSVEVRPVMIVSTVTAWRARGPICAICTRR